MADDLEGSREVKGPFVLCSQSAWSEDIRNKS